MSAEVQNNMSLVVKSAIGEEVKKADMRMAADTYDALEKVVAGKIAKAVERAKGNNRKTIMPQDL